MRLAIAAVVVLCSTPAFAGPSTRFGLTFAATDQGAPNEHELGPLVAIGERFGGFILEADYAYLSMMDPDTSENGIHRFGLNLRGDVWRDDTGVCHRHLACTRGKSIFLEAGAAERFGQWHLDSRRVSPESDRQPEVHVGVGLELDNRIVPYRYGWQLGFRFAIAPRNPYTYATRTDGTTMDTGGRSLDKALLVEWSFLVGR